MVVIEKEINDSFDSIDNNDKLLPDVGEDKEATGEQRICM